MSSLKNFEAIFRYDVINVGKGKIRGFMAKFRPILIPFVKIVKKTDLLFGYFAHGHL